MTYDACVYCAVAVSAVLTNAHRHDDPAKKKTWRLCWNCHRLYDIGVIPHAEIEWVIERKQPRDLSTIYRELETDLARGRRQIDFRLHDGRSEEEKSSAAKQSWATRRRADQKQRAQSLFDIGSRLPQQ